MDFIDFQMFLWFFLDLYGCYGIGLPEAGLQSPKNIRILNYSMFLMEFIGFHGISGIGMLLASIRTPKTLKY